MSTESEVIEERVGSHAIRFHPPDLVVAHFVGDVAEDAVRALERGYNRPPGKLYGVILTAQMGSMTSGARRAVRALRVPNGCAIVGASKKMEIVISLLKKMVMIANLGLNYPVAFVRTEEEALRWVDHLRSTA